MLCVHQVRTTHTLPTILFPLFFLLMNISFTPHSKPSTHTNQYIHFNICFSLYPSHSSKLIVSFASEALQLPMDFSEQLQLNFFGFYIYILLCEKGTSCLWSLIQPTWTHRIHSVGNPLGVLELFTSLHSIFVKCTTWTKQLLNP